MGIGMVGINRLAKHATDFREEFVIVEHILDRVGQTFPCVLHFLQEVQAGARPCPSVAQVVEIGRQFLGLLAQRSGGGIVCRENGLVVVDDAPGTSQRRVRFVPAVCQRRKFRSECLLLFGETIMLLPKGSKSLCRRVGGGGALRLPGRLGFNLVLQFAQTALQCNHLLLALCVLPADGFDLAIDIGQTLRRRGDLLRSTFSLAFECGEPARHVIQPLFLFIDLLPCFADGASEHLFALRGVADDTLCFGLPLEEKLVSLLQVVASNLGGPLAVLNVDERLRKRAPLVLEFGKTARQSRQLHMQIVELVERQMRSQMSVSTVEFLKATSLFGLPADDAQPPLRACELFTNADKVDFGAFEFAFGFLAANLEACDTRSFFQNSATLHGVGLQHRRNPALLDDRICIGADTGIQKEFLDVAQADFVAIDEIIAAAIAVEPSGHGDLVCVD